MFTIKNIHVAKDFSGKYDLLVVGAQDGENKVPAKSSFSALSNQSMQLTLKSEKKFGSDLKKLTGAKIEDIYQYKPITVSPDTDLSEITTLMAEKDVHTLPVLESDKLVGIIGKKDVIRAMA